jgi:hypothetical protein
MCVCVCVCAVWRAFSSALPSSSQANENLESAKVELQDEEDELVNMYSKWLDEDSEEMEVSKEEMTTLKEQLKTVQDNVKAHSESIGTKADALAEKEKRLTVSRRPNLDQNTRRIYFYIIPRHTMASPPIVGLHIKAHGVCWGWCGLWIVTKLTDTVIPTLQSYQFKIQQKQNYLDEMSEVLKKLNQSTPNTEIDAEAEKYVWDDEVKGETEEDYYNECVPPLSSDVTSVRIVPFFLWFAVMCV